MLAVIRWGHHLYHGKVITMKTNYLTPSSLAGDKVPPAGTYRIHGS
jgi:hypothetical protein